MLVSCAPMVCAAGDADVMSTPAKARPLTTAAAVNLRNIPLRIENLLVKNCNCFSYVARVNLDSRTIESRVAFRLAMSDARATRAHGNAARTSRSQSVVLRGATEWRDEQQSSPAC
jgi:hypothetical protein